MSTRAYIGIQNEIGNGIRFIYAHSDNYLSGVGKTLLNFYKSREKVQRLISHGHASYIGPRINPRKNRKHTFEYSDAQKDVCVFYARDRGDGMSGPYETITPTQFRKLVGGGNTAVGLAYYIDKDSVWWISRAGENFLPLASFPETALIGKK
jgi:hypothetical protein